MCELVEDVNDECENVLKNYHQLAVKYKNLQNKLKSKEAVIDILKAKIKLLEKANVNQPPKRVSQVAERQYKCPNCYKKFRSTKKLNVHQCDV